MDIKLDDMLRFVEQAVDAGVQRYRLSIEPEEDRVNQAYAKKYIARLGYRPVMLQRWVDARLLTPVKCGDRQNSPVYYSMADIKTLLTTLKLKEITIKTKRL